MVFSTSYPTRSHPTRSHQGKPRYSSSSYSSSSLVSFASLSLSYSSYPSYTSYTSYPSYSLHTFLFLSASITIMHHIRKPQRKPKPLIYISFFYRICNLPRVLLSKYAMILYTTTLLVTLLRHLLCYCSCSTELL